MCVQPHAAAGLAASHCTCPQSGRLKHGMLRQSFNFSMRVWMSKTNDTCMPNTGKVLDTWGFYELGAVFVGVPMMRALRLWASTIANVMVPFAAYGK